MVDARIHIPFNKPFLAGDEEAYVAKVVRQLALGEGEFTTGCARLLEEAFGIPRAMMTPSCTAALEMAALLCRLEPGDEVILPSYTFVSTANAFALRGARPVFVDVRPDTLNLDERLLEAAITPRTRAIVPVHYGGVACEMDEIMEIAGRHGVLVVEDAAQGVHSYYKGAALGSIGDLGAYSFHHTKNYVCGEGGALCVNRGDLTERAEILRDKGTNRQKFFRGEVDKYTWLEAGSSFIPAEIACAFLLGQLESREAILQRRMAVYQRYHSNLEGLEQQGYLRRPCPPSYCAHNAHLYFILLPDEAEQQRVRLGLKERGIGSATHYVPLHLAPMGRTYGYRPGQLPVTEDVATRLLRLPLHAGMRPEEVDEVSGALEELQTSNHAPRAVGA